MIRRQKSSANLFVYRLSDFLHALLFAFVSILPHLLKLFSLFFHLNGDSSHTSISFIYFPY
ncbi:hypothetical protein D068_cds02230 [Bacillus atrophaeus UCMB-5137]|nr:hypothetical protein D068_cds02230 [Bacillus atrophaeus UCMB-5137]